MSFFPPPQMMIKALVGKIPYLNVGPQGFRYKGMHIERCSERMCWYGVVRGHQHVVKRLIFDDRELIDMPQESMEPWVEKAFGATFRALSDELTKLIMKETEEKMAIGGHYNTLTTAGTSFIGTGTSDYYILKDLAGAKKTAETHHLKKAAIAQSPYDKKGPLVDILRGLNRSWLQGVSLT